MGIIRIDFRDAILSAAGPHPLGFLYHLDHLFRGQRYCLFFFRKDDTRVIVCRYIINITSDHYFIAPRVAPVTHITGRIIERICPVLVLTDKISHGIYADDVKGDIFRGLLLFKADNIRPMVDYLIDHAVNCDIITAGRYPAYKIISVLCEGIDT